MNDLSLGLKPTLGHSFANAIHQGFFGTFLESSLGGFCLGPRGVIFQLQFGGASVHRKHQTSWMARYWKIECGEFRQNCWQTHKLIWCVKRRSSTELKMFGITFAIFKTALDWWWNITPPFCRAFARSNLKVLCCARSCNSWPLEGATLWAILKGTSFLTSYDVWNRNLPSLERGTSFGSMASLIRRHHPHHCLRARTHFYRTGLSWRCSRCSKPPPQWKLNISYHVINQSHEWSASQET